MMTDRIALAEFRAVVRRKAALALCVALCMVGLGLSASAQTITTFDAPGAGTGPGQGTQGLGISPAGTIVGFDIDASGVNHGFLRAPDGTFTTFDAPGAGTRRLRRHSRYQPHPGGGGRGILH